MKMELKNRGQMLGHVSEGMLGLLFIVAIAFVTIQVAQSLITNTSGGLTPGSAAAMAAGNFSDGLWDSFQLMSLTPYLIGALVVIGIVVMFARYVGMGHM